MEASAVMGPCQAARREHPRETRGKARAEGVQARSVKSKKERSTERDGDGRGGAGWQAA